MRRSAAVIGAGGVHGLPAALTSFIGRADPVCEVADLLYDQYVASVQDFARADAVGRVRADATARAVVLYGGLHVLAAGAYIMEMAELGLPEALDRATRLQDTLKQRRSPCRDHS